MSYDRQPDDLTELRAALRADAAGVAEALLGAPNKAASTKSTLRWGGKGSIAVEIRGAKQGLWYSHESVSGSDMLGLIRFALGCNFPDAVAWARQRTGIAPAWGMDAEANERLAQQGADRQARQAEQAAADATADAEDVARRITLARKLWAESVPIAGTLAEQYLVKARRIPAPGTLDDIQGSSAVWPQAIRFHAPSRSLIVAATLADGTVQAVQRVRLTDDARKVEPTPDKPTKTTNGLLDGAVVRLPAMVTVDVIHGDLAPLILAEGPETALSVWAATGLEVWCALGSVATVDLPGSRPVTIASDDNPSATDPNPKRRGAAKALAAALTRWSADGHQVRIAYPWPARRHDGSDFNDLLQADGIAAVRVRIAGSAAPEPPPARRLPAYHQAATEPRDTALARQKSIIDSTISEGAERVGIRIEVRRRRDAEAERLELDLDFEDDVTPQKKAALTRRFTREVLAERGLTTMPRSKRVLITGSQGSGKTAAALLALSLIENDLVAWMTVPVLAKAEEALADYQQLAGPNSLPGMVVRGRGAPDPEHGDYQNGVLVGEQKTKMCRRPKMAERVARRGFSVRKLICPKCPLFEVCGSIRQERAIGGLGNRGVFFQARNYLSMQSPAPTPDILVADERVTIEAVDDVLSISPDILRSAIPFPGASLDVTIRGSQAIDRMRAALMGPAPLATIRQSETMLADLKEALKLLEAAMERHEPEIDGTMSDNKIMDLMDGLPINNLGNVASTVRAVLRELPTGRDRLTAVEYFPACRVKVNGKEEEQPRVLVHRLRRHRFPPVTLLLDGTGSAALNRVLLPNLEHHHIPIERNAYVVGTVGKSYSRQSITGCDRDGNPLAGKEASAKRLRKEIAAVTLTMPGNVLLAGSKRAIEAIEQDGLLPNTVATAHFGALRGLNTWEQAETGFSVGRESISLARLENLGRAFLATDPVPFTPFVRPDLKDWPWTTWPYRATRGRRMRDGTVEAMEVEVHPDPRVQEVLEQIREAEVTQGIDRPRPIFNRRYLTLANDLVLDVTYDRTLTHAELVGGGTRWDRAWNATGVIPLGAADLHQVHPQIFPSPNAAKLALRTIQTSGVALQIDSYLNGDPTCFRYRREGQRGSASQVAVDLKRHRNPRLAVEAHLGALVLFEPLEPPDGPNGPKIRPQPSEPVKPYSAPGADPGWMPDSGGLTMDDLARWEGQFAHELDVPSDLPAWLTEPPSWSPADLERVMAEPHSYDADTIALERDDMLEPAELPEQPGLDPGAVYGRGALVSPLSDEWTIRVPGKPPIQVRGLPGIQTDMPRSVLSWVWPLTPPIPRNFATALIPDAQARPWVGLPEPGD